ncbi:hypothetical protein CMUS01_00128 [Colletotrichum musicola]|uniref:Uncharacterized protein n=1 Tax=Colletotrichum musicola TaxID=2175873 RepID=A0A8H6NZ86_9PEZI|nr:hypothetical protein CMUS01_00128 [Colletotrichum musicola]
MTAETARYSHRQPRSAAEISGNIGGCSKEAALFPRRRPESSSLFHELAPLRRVFVIWQYVGRKPCHKHAPSGSARQAGDRELILPAGFEFRRRSPDPGGQLRQRWSGRDKCAHESTDASHSRISDSDSGGPRVPPEASTFVVGAESDAKRIPASSGFPSHRNALQRITPHPKNTQHATPQHALGPE